MKKIALTFSIIVMSICSSLAQSNPYVLNGYKYALIQVLEYPSGNIDTWGISKKVTSTIEQKGIKVLKNRAEIERIKPPKNEIFQVLINHSRICEGCGSKKVYLTFKNYQDKIIYKSTGSGVCAFSIQCEVDKATKRALNGITYLNYKFDPSLTPKIVFPEVEKTEETSESLKAYFSSNSLTPIEGIYKSYQGESMGYYKIGVKKFDNNYKAIILESDYEHWEIGEVKAVFESTSMQGLYSVKWYNADKTSQETFAEIENGVILSVEFENPKTNEKHVSKFIKMYPKAENNFSVDKSQKSSGSGFFLTQNGIIATNAHVVENAEKITIHLSNELGDFDYGAKVLLKDSKNDVAILKIDDDKFKGLTEIPYSLTERADVGEEAFTIGYPLNDVMGTNYKVTDGIVSSASGIDDDIRFYQISVPLQPGNSGGPLFNKSGNIIGITTAKLNSETVGTAIENVNYAIKISYLLNLYNMLPNQPSIGTKSSLTNKELHEQIKILKNYVVLIKIN